MNKLHYFFLSLILGFASRAMEQTNLLNAQLVNEVLGRNVNAAVAKRLIRAGAEVNKSFLNKSLLIWAILGNNEPAVRLLLDLGADVNKSDNRDETPLHRPVWVGSFNLKTKDFDDRTPLMVAISEKHYPIVQLLVKSGADVCEKDWWGDTALTVAANLGDPKYAELIIDRLLQLPSDVQLKKAYTLLLCLKQKGCPKELCPMIWRCMPKVIEQENREFPLQSIACREMKEITNAATKKKFFEQYWPGMVSEVEQGGSWCLIL